MGAWKPSTALEVTQIRLHGIVLRTSVQADRPVVLGPVLRCRANWEASVETGVLIDEMF
jgi:hypothetical protein